MISELAGVEWSVAARPAEGHAESGDFSCVREVEGGVLLVAVDVLGHGTGAATAARELEHRLEIEPVTDLPGLFARCDAWIRSQRGAVMTAVLVLARERRIRYLGVGNVQAVIVRAANPAAREWLLLRSGVLGNGVGALEARSSTIETGDVVVLATDGIHAAYASAIDPFEPVDAIARTVLERHARPVDDALVLAARCAGSA
jgi:hypothetical protein